MITILFNCDHCGECNEEETMDSIEFTSMHRWNHQLMEKIEDDNGYFCESCQKKRDEMSNEDYRQTERE